MKKAFYFLVLLPVFLIGQSNLSKHDYFIQFNMSKFADKVSLDSMFNHDAFKTFNKQELNYKLKDLMSFMDQSKAVVMHGNITDSIPYYQISFPIKDNKDLSAYFFDRVAEENNNAYDTLKTQITCANSINASKYCYYTPKNSSFTIGWNNEHLVIYELTGITTTQYALDPQAEYADTTAVLVEEAPDEYVSDDVQETTTDAPIISEEKTSEEVDEQVAVPVEDTEQEEENDEEYMAYLESMKKAQQEERNKKIAKQEIQLDALFKNGFSMPVSSQVNTDSAISMWLNYQAIYEKFASIPYLFKGYKPNLASAEKTASIKGMNADFYFENDKAKMVQTIEYAPSLATIMQKIIAKKPNKNVFNYFPKNEPLGYMTYHSSTEEVLKNYPQIMDQFLATMPFESEDREIITDLFSTLIDEKASATLFDGDFSMFLHAVEQYESTYTVPAYSDDYEEKAEERKITKTRPVFTFIITSSHPTISEKILNLGVRKRVLTKENNYYVITKTEDLGNVVIFKDKDVLVLTNGLNYLNNGSKSAFAKQVKKELSNNYFVGNFDIAQFMNSYFLNQNLGKDQEKMMKLSNQFKNIKCYSSNKISDNKMTFEMELNSNFNDKNIIIQTLDLVKFLK